MNIIIIPEEAKRITKGFFLKRHPDKENWFNMAWEIISENIGKVPDTKSDVIFQQALSIAGESDATMQEMVKEVAVFIESFIIKFPQAREPLTTTVMAVSQKYGMGKKWTEDAIKHIKDEIKVEVLTDEGPMPYDALHNLNRKRQRYLIWIDERKAECFVDNEEVKITSTHKKVLVHLLENFNNVVSYKELFLEYAFVKYTRTTDSRSFEKVFHDPEDRNLVHRWILELHKETNSALHSYIECIPATGYKISGDFKFCIVYRKKYS